MVHALGRKYSSLVEVSKVLKVPAASLYKHKDDVETYLISKGFTEYCRGGKTYLNFYEFCQEEKLPYGIIMKCLGKSLNKASIVEIDKAIVRGLEIKANRLAGRRNKYNKERICLKV